MTTNGRLDEIQSRLNNIEARFNNMDTRFNNLDSHLNNIENHLTNPQLNNPDVFTQLKQQLERIEGKLESAYIRDVQFAWLTFAAVGAGFVGVGAVDILHNWPALLVGVVTIIIGYCGVRFRLFTRRS
jgi:tetrahydromethanopterin S-methyltransferase subunit G